MANQFDNLPKKLDMLQPVSEKQIEAAKEEIISDAPPKAAAAFKSRRAQPIEDVDFTDVSDGVEKAAEGMEDASEKLSSTIESFAKSVDGIVEPTRKSSVADTKEKIQASTKKLQDTESPQSSQDNSEKTNKNLFEKLNDLITVKTKESDFTGFGREAVGGLVGGTVGAIPGFEKVGSFLNDLIGFVDPDKDPAKETVEEVKKVNGGIGETNKILVNLKDVNDKQTGHLQEIISVLNNPAPQQFGENDTATPALSLPAPTPIAELQSNFDAMNAEETAAEQAEMLRDGFVAVDDRIEGTNERLDSVIKLLENQDTGGDDGGGGLPDVTDMIKRRLPSPVGRSPKGRGPVGKPSGPKVEPKQLPNKAKDIVNAEEKLVKKGALKGAAKGVGRTALKAVPFLGAALTAYDAVEGAMNAEEMLGIKDRDASVGERVAAGLGGVAEGLSFGLIESKDVAGGLINASKSVGSKVDSLMAGPADSKLVPSLTRTPSEVKILSNVKDTAIEAKNDAKMSQLMAPVVVNAASDSGPTRVPMDGGGASSNPMSIRNRESSYERLQMSKGFPRTM